MGFDQKGATVFCVVQGQNGQWNVCEEGFEKPLASFDQEQDAREYAEGISRSKSDSTVQQGVNGGRLNGV